MDRINISSGAKWEPLVGYSRAVRIGPHVWVAGTTAAGADGRALCVGDPAGQTRHILQSIDRALNQAGAAITDVVRTRIFVTRIEDWEAIGRVHGEFFGAIRPACTLVAVARLVDPELLVEIEAEAYVRPA